MHFSHFASELRCVHCGKTHGVSIWPLRGDAVSFYYDKEPGNFTLQVTCPHCNATWYVFWDHNPGPPTELTIGSTANCAHGVWLGEGARRKEKSS